MSVKEIPIPLDELIEKEHVHGRNMFVDNKDFYLEEIMKLTKDDLKTYAKALYFILKVSEFAPSTRKTFHDTMDHPDFHVFIKKSGRIGNCRCGHEILYYDIMVIPKGKNELIRDFFTYSPAHVKNQIKWWKK